MPRFTVLVILHLFSVSHGLCAAEFSEISFETDDDATIYANLYGTGEHALILAHGAIFNKESWHALSTALAEDGLQVLAIDFRGYGKSKPRSRSSGMYLDLLAVIEFLSNQGAKRASMLGVSMGGGAASQSGVEARSSELNKLILLAPVRVVSPKRLHGNKLFVVS